MKTNEQLFRLKNGTTGPVGRLPAPTFLTSKDVSNVRAGDRFSLKRSRRGSAAEQSSAKRSRPGRSSRVSFDFKSKNFMSIERTVKNVKKVSKIVLPNTINSSSLGENQFRRLTEHLEKKIETSIDKSIDKVVERHLALRFPTDQARSVVKSSTCLSISTYKCESNFSNWGCLIFL